jgi:hypothetical protein
MKFREKTKLDNEKLIKSFQKMSDQILSDKVINGRGSASMLVTAYTYLAMLQNGYLQGKALKKPR